MSAERLRPWWVIYDLTRIIAAVWLVLLAIFASDPATPLAIGLVVYISTGLLVSLLRYLDRRAA